MKTFLPQEIHHAVMKLDRDALLELNRIIVERLKIISKAQHIKEMGRFTAGERVSFNTQDGVKNGLIVRLNQKTVSIHTDDGQRWNVAPHFLSKTIE